MPRLLANTKMIWKYKSSLSSCLFSSRDSVLCCRTFRFTLDFHHCIVSGTPWNLSLDLSGVVSARIDDFAASDKKKLRHMGASQQCLHVSQTFKQDLCICKVDTQAFKSDDS